MNPWQPTATLDTLKSRAGLFAVIRHFFAQNNVMEVDVPVLSEVGVTDLHIDCIPAELTGGRQYLQSSPEYFMKRLLAAGSGSIYYLGKAFRDGELGRKHRPEFTMLEWYRDGWDEHQLMEEVALLLATLQLKSAVQSASSSLTLFDAKRTQKIPYADIVAKVVGLDPHDAPLGDVQSCASEVASADYSSESRSTCLDLIFSIAVEPQLPEGLVFIYDYPSCQSALAQLGKDDQHRTVARRFEAYLNRMELANGYYELVDPVELKSRFDADCALRRALGKRSMAIDDKLLGAMASGLPSCAGVALGVDRLLMQMLGVDQISKVVSFGNG